MSKLDDSSYRYDIDGLRAISVLAVIIFHLSGNYLPSGFVGVDVFFVISGYVVTRSIFKDKRPLFKMLKSFYFRRLRRLLPGLVMMIALGFSFIFLFLPRDEFEEMMRIGRFALLGVSNFALIENNVEYFRIGDELNLFTHTWSLGVEEQFYLIFPFYFFLLRTLWKKSKHGLTYLAITVPMSLSFYFIFIKTDHPAAFTYYFMPLRIWELLLGVLFFYFEYKYRDRRSYSFLADPRIKTIFLFFLVGSFFVVTPHKKFPLMAISIASIATFFLLFEEVAKSSLLYRLISSKWMVFIGGISYSLYLYHFLLFSIFRWTFGLNSIFTQCCAVFLTFGIAVTSYYAIERPIRFSPLGNKIVIPFILLITVVLFFFTGEMFLSGVDGPLAFNSFKRPRNWDEYVKDCVYKTYKTSEEESFKECLAPGKGKTLYMVGDSHVLQFVPTAKAIEDSAKLVVRYIHNNGFPKMLKYSIIPKEVSYVLESAKKGDILLISLFRDKFLSSPYHIPLDRNPLEDKGAMWRMKSFRESFEQVYNVASNRGISIVLVNDVPQLNSLHSVTPCILQEKLSLNNSCNVSREQSLHTRLPMTTVFIELSQRKGVFYWDPHDLVCDKKICTYENDRFITMLDYNHISLDQALDLAPDFLKFIQGIP